MGNQASAPTGPGQRLQEVDSKTRALHQAIREWNLKDATRALEKGASPTAYRVLPPFGETFVSFDSQPREEGRRFAVNALGKLWSEVLISLTVADRSAPPPASRTPSKRAAAASELPFTRDSLTAWVDLLLGKGADPTQPLEMHGGVGPDKSLFYPGRATAVDGVRMAVAAGRDEPTRRHRCTLLGCAGVSQLLNARVTCVALADLLFWASLGSEEVLEAIAGRKLVVAVQLAGAAPGAPLRRVPPVVAAVEAGSTAALRLLLDAGASPGSATDDGVTALMRCTGDFVAAPARVKAPGMLQGEGAAGGGGGAPAADAAPSSDGSGSGGSGVAVIADAALQQEAGLGAGAAEDGGDDEDAEAAAVHRPMRALVELLLQAGAPVDARDMRGNTALHHFAASTSPALQQDHALRVAMSIRLMRAGADPLALNVAGETPLQMAVQTRGDTRLAVALGRESAWARRGRAVAFWAASSPAAATPAFAAALAAGSTRGALMSPARTTAPAAAGAGVVAPASAEASAVGGDEAGATSAAAAGAAIAASGEGAEPASAASEHAAGHAGGSAGSTATGGELHPPRAPPEEEDGEKEGEEEEKDVVEGEGELPSTSPATPPAGTPAGGQPSAAAGAEAEAAAGEPASAPAPGAGDAEEEEESREPPPAPLEEEREAGAEEGAKAGAAVGTPAGGSSSAEDDGAALQ